MQIFIKTLSGTTLTLNVNRSDTVLALKREIYNRTETPPDMQRIIFAGKQLEEDISLMEYNV